MGGMAQEAKFQSNVWDTLRLCSGQAADVGPEYGKTKVLKEFGSYGRRGNTY